LQTGAGGAPFGPGQPVPPVVVLLEGVSFFNGLY